MGPEQGLLDDIVANLDDDTPRLVYADLLEERGQDRTAQFIRLQVERARLPDWGPRASELDAALDRLWDHRPTAIPVPEWARFVGYRRGFPTSAVVRPLLDSVDVPPTTLDDLTLVGGGWGWLDAGTRRLLGQARALRLPAWGPTEAGPPLYVRQPALRDADDLAALLRGCEMPHLRELDLGAFPHRAGWVDLAVSAYGRSLLRDQDVAVPFWEHGPAVAQVLASSGLLARLEGLRLTRLLFGEVGGLALATYRMPKLRRLDLLDTGLIQEALAALAPCLELLTTLRLNSPGPADAASPFSGRVVMVGLEELDVTAAEFDAGLWDDVVDFSRLRALVLDLVGLEDRFWPQDLPSSLRRLSLRGCRLNDRDITHLAQWPGLASVERLNLADNYGLGTRGLGELARSPFRENLRELLLPRPRDEDDRRLIRFLFGDCASFVW